MNAVVLVVEMRRSLKKHDDDVAVVSSTVNLQRTHHRAGNGSPSYHAGGLAASPLFHY